MRRTLARLGLIALIVVTAVTAVLTLAREAATLSTRSVAARRDPTPAPRERVDALSTPPEQATVVLYGDSLAWEAQEHFRDALVAGGVGQVRTNTFGGTAICDWLDQMRVDALALRPTAVVVEFSGNALTPCMHDASSGDAYYQQYTNDAREVLRIFAATATRVYFAGYPTNRRAEEAHDRDAGRLNAVYAALQLEHANARFVDAGAAVLRAGHWTQTLTCLPVEPCTGGFDDQGRAVNSVRAPDGAHFCPAAPDAVDGVTGTCTVWSSGAFRYGNAMAAPVVRDLAAARTADLT